MRNVIMRTVVIFFVIEVVLALSAFACDSCGFDFSLQIPQNWNGGCGGFHGCGSHSCDNPPSKPPAIPPGKPPVTPPGEPPATPQEPMTPQESYKYTGQISVTIDPNPEYDGSSSYHLDDINCPDCGPTLPKNPELGKVEINKISPKSLEGTASIELYNPGIDSIDLNGWQIQNSARVAIVTLQNTKIAPKGSVVVDVQGLRDGSSGDVLSLHSPSGTRVDSAIYLDAAHLKNEGKSYSKRVFGMVS